jgi:hypothetical protein
MQCGALPAFHAALPAPVCSVWSLRQDAHTSTGFPRSPPQTARLPTPPHPTPLPAVQRTLLTPRLRTPNRAFPSCVLLAPTRELATQLAAEAGRLLAATHAKVCVVTGGVPIVQQVGRELASGRGWLVTGGWAPAACPSRSRWGTGLGP